MKKTKTKTKTETKTETKTNTKTKYKLDPTCAIFLKRLGRNGVKYGILIIMKKLRLGQIQRQRQRQRQIQRQRPTHPFFQYEPMQT